METFRKAKFTILALSIYPENMKAVGLHPKKLCHFTKVLKKDKNQGRFGFLTVQPRPCDLGQQFWRHFKGHILLD